MLPISTLISKILSKMLRLDIVSNIGWTITSNGKLFHTISIIVYLSLVRLKISFVYLYLFFHYNHLERSTFCLYCPLNFSKGANFQNQVSAIAWCFGFLLIPLLLVVLGWQLSNSAFFLALRRFCCYCSCIVVWSLFHIICVPYCTRYSTVRYVFFRIGQEKNPPL